MVFRQATVVFLLIFSSFHFSASHSQTDTLHVSKSELEAIFLKNNLILLNENLNISKAEAEIIQAKVWPNPTLSIDEVNLWRPKHIGTEELIPPLAGDFGRNQQFSIGFEQLIFTAGKRKKLIELKKIGAEQHQQYFEEVLRNLKLEFRLQLFELEHLNSIRSIIENQLTSINLLLNAYKNQVEQGFLTKGEAIRLGALSLSIQNELNTIETEYDEIEHTVKLLLNIPLTSHLRIKEEVYNKEIESLKFTVESLVATAKANRPDYHLSNLAEKYAEQQLKVERAERIPDISLLGEYNRGDGIYRDFVGFGIAFDLPVFNRNKGGIKMANIELEQAKINQKFVNNSIEKEVSLALNQLQRAQNFISNIEENYEEELDQVLFSYTENFKNKNINLLEYLDFLEAYLDNKHILLEAKLNLKSKVEELNYIIGKDLISF